MGSPDATRGFRTSAAPIASDVLRSRAFGSRLVTPTTKSHAPEIMNANEATIATAATYNPATWSATSNAAPTSWAA